MTLQRNACARWLGVLLATAGCGTSNAVIMGLPSGTETAAPMGSTAAPPRLGSGGSAGQTARPMQPPASGTVGGSAGLSGGTVAPPRTAAAAGTMSVVPAASAGSAASSAGTMAVAAMPAGAAGTAQSPPATGACRAAPYSLAVRLTLGVTWAETIALMAGDDHAYIWSKLTIDPTTNTVSEFRMCGSLFPVYSTTAVAGSNMVFQRVPQAAFDMPTMPKMSGGTANQADSDLTVEPGVLVLGLQLSDPNGPWPSSATDPSVMPVDADGDGNPGLTSVMRNDDKFSPTPTSIVGNARIDANYVANRLSYRATLSDACADTLAGTAELMAWDTMMLGCHVKDGADCTPEERMFIDDARPALKFAAQAVADAAVMQVDATCAQVVEVLDVPGP